MTPILAVVLAGIVFVDAGATGANDGTSWEDAFVELQSALDVAGPGAPVWVAAGTYRPTRLLEPLDPRSATFELLQGHRVYGGFAGDETSLSQRDVLANETVLSGDLLGDDGTGGFRDNAYHVVTVLGTDTQARLDGFVVTAGRADGTTYADRTGGGVRIQYAKPTLRLCRVTGNVAAEQGGGLSIEGPLNFGAVARPRILHCVIEENVAEGDAPAGGGLYLVNSGALVVGCLVADNAGVGLLAWGSIMSVALIDSRFEANSDRGARLGGPARMLRCDFVGNQGGGAFLSGLAGGHRVVACRFLGNVRGSSGAGMRINGGDQSTVADCVFSGNVCTDGEGAGLHVTDSIGFSIDVESCTFSANVAEQGVTGGLFANADYARVRVDNCIAWGNAGSGATDQTAQLLLAGMQIDLRHSVVQGLLGDIPGEDNLGVDPLFVDPSGPDGVAGTADDDLRLSSRSPAIDAGDALLLPPDELDIADEVDAGAFEFQL